MFKSIICKLLGIKYPLIQGGMAWIADAELLKKKFVKQRG